MWHCSRRVGSLEPKLAAGITISHRIRSPVLNRSRVTQYSPSLLRFSVILGMESLPDCRNSLTGQCTATRFFLRRSADEATAATPFPNQQADLPSCHNSQTPYAGLRCPIFPNSFTLSRLLASSFDDPAWTMRLDDCKHGVKCQLCAS